MVKKKILVVFGTRPEAIKMAPVVKELNLFFKVIVCVTAQHREMLDEVLNVFAIVPEYDLDIMLPGQDLTSMSANILIKVSRVIQDIVPDLVLVHGDTTTSMCAALAAFYNKIKIGHVEAGLRSHNKMEPFPEEINRKFIGTLADYHFAPTQTAKNNLINEGVFEGSIYVTGNTVIDALLEITKRIALEPTSAPKQHAKKKILLTAHRRESLESGLDNIFSAVSILAEKYPNFEFIYPVHPNPIVQGKAKSILEGISNVSLIDPLDYLSFIKLMQESHIILTDSGGIQEEAPSLGVPVLVLRNVTERTEAIEANCVRLVGLEIDSIVTETSRLIEDDQEYNLMSSATNPYGIGCAAAKIVEIIRNDGI
jgi:UDP-N-acetylglucosamine 2-epimerase (non-hydrolysing)